MIYSSKQCGKSVQILNTLKRLVWVFYNRGERDKDNGTGLKERGRIEILTTVLHSRCTLLRFEYSPESIGPRSNLFNV